MTFQEWLRSLGFDPEAISQEQSRNLSAQYDLLRRAQQTSTPAVTPTQTVTATETEPDPIAAARAARAAETERVNETERVCRMAGNPMYTMEDGSKVDLAAHAIKAGWPVHEVKREAELIQLRNARVSGPGYAIRAHDKDCTLQALQGAMILRSGAHRGIGLDHPAFRSQAAIALKVPEWLRAGINAEQKQRAMEWAHRYSGMSMFDMCREACRIDGKDFAETYERSEIIQAAVSGGVLTSIFTTNVNTILLATYEQSPDTTMAWTREQEVNDFKTNERPRMTKGPDLVKLPRGSQADHVSRTDTGESYKIARYAKMFEVDEQDIIDDRYGALSDTPYEMGQAAKRLRPDLVYAILLSNPNLAYTAKALFDATNDTSNDLTGAALNSANLQAAIGQMAIVKEGTVNLNLRATHLLTPPTAYGFTARNLVRSTSIVVAGTAGTVTTQGEKNVLENLVEPVEDPRLQNGVVDPSSGTSYSGSATKWYLVSTMAHTIEVGFLRGTGKAPQVRAYVLERGRWGLGWDVTLDIGAKALDWKGMQRNAA